MSTRAVTSPIRPNEPSVRADEPSDLELVERVCAGAVHTFGVLVQRHNQALHRACRAVLGDPEEAEDAVQTAWIAAYRSLSSFRGDATFRTWVTRIAVHEASARLRRRKRLADATASVREVTMTTEGAHDPERDAFTDELRHMLERHVEALPEGLRAVLVLRDVLELDTAETAASLGVSEEAVRVRLFRARRALARSITEATKALALEAMPDVWRFAGERCRAMADRVVAAIEALPRER